MCNTFLNKQKRREHSLYCLAEELLAMFTAHGKQSNTECIQHFPACFGCVNLHITCVHVSVKDLHLCAVEVWHD